MYPDMIAILKQIFKAEMLYFMLQMPPFVAASGHNLYTKKSYIYLQNKVKLPSTRPEVYKLFQEGVMDIGPEYQPT